MTRLTKTGLWIVGGGIVFAILPLISILIAGGIANALDCQLDESGVHPCPFLGMDIGGALSFFALFGWLALVTLPVGGIIAGSGLLVLLIAGLRKLRR